MDTRFPFSPAEVAKVHMVQFGILSPDEIVILWPSFNLVIRAFFLFFQTGWRERERERDDVRRESCLQEIMFGCFALICS
jgi:hypothetical protein